MVALIYNLKTQEAKTGGLSRLQGETQSENKTKQKQDRKNSSLCSHSRLWSWNTYFKIKACISLDCKSRLYKKGKAW